MTIWLNTEFSLVLLFSCKGLSVLCCILLFRDINCAIIYYLFELFELYLYMSGGLDVCSVWFFNSDTLS